MRFGLAGLLGFLVATQVLGIVAFLGVVLAGESYDDAAKRELAEELGITGVRLEGHFDFFYEDAGNRVWGRVFSCVYNGDVILQEEEVESGAFHPVHEILELSRNRLFTPDGLYVLQRFLAQGLPAGDGG